MDASEAPAVAVPETLANHPARRSFFDVNRRRSGIARTAGGDGSANNRAADQARGKACRYAALGACRGRKERAGNRRDREEGRKCLLHFLVSPGGGALDVQRRVLRSTHAEFETDRLARKRTTVNLK